MTRKELADFIRANTDGDRLDYVFNDVSVIVQHTMQVFYEHLHITNEHVLECCEKAGTYIQFIELCRPMAKADTEAWRRERNKPPPKKRKNQKTL